jgi:hypothetical protein
MQSFYVSKEHIERCSNPEKYIVTKPNIFRVNQLQDISVISLKSNVKINAMYVANHIIKSFLNVHSPVDLFFKPPKLFFNITLKHACGDELALIKDISSRKCLFSNRHIIFIDLSEVLSPDIKQKVISFLKSCNNILFIVYSDCYIPIEINNISLCIALPCKYNIDPFNIFILDSNTETNNIDFSKVFVKRNIDKLVACNTIATYHTTLRKFILHITAAGIPVHYICKEIISEYKSCTSLINIVAEMESKCASYSKSIFPLEYNINRLILLLRARVKN